MTSQHQCLLYIVRRHLLPGGNANQARQSRSTRCGRQIITSCGRDRWNRLAAHL